MFIGIALHKREAQVAVRDDDGELIEETRVDNEDPQPIAERYAGGEALLEATRLLMTIPGVSHYTALVIYAELGEIDPFDRAKEVVRYVGLNPVVRESGDFRFEGGISKNGPGKVRCLLVQAGHSAVQTVEDPCLNRFYHRLERKKNSKKAAVATARKLLMSIYHMLDRCEVYDPPGVNV